MVKTLSICAVIVFITVSLLIFMPDNSEQFDPSYYYDTSAAKKMVVASAAWNQGSDTNLIWNEETGRNEYQPTPFPDNGGSSGTNESTNYPPPANAYFPLLDPRNTGYTVNAHPDGAVTASNAPAPPGVLGYNGTVRGTHQGTDLGTRTQGGNRYQNLYQPSNYDTVHAVKAGIVVTVEDSGIDGLGVKGAGFGYHVMLAHKDGTLTLYGHMVRGSSNLKAGDSVSAGQVIGRRGNTGNSSGAHLHLETRTVGTAIDLSKATTYRSVFYGPTAKPIHNTYIKALNVPANTSKVYSMSSISKDEIPPELWSVYGIS